MPDSLFEISLHKKYALLHNFSNGWNKDLTSEFSVIYICTKKFVI